MLRCPSFLFLVNSFSKSLNTYLMPEKSGRINKEMLRQLEMNPGHLAQVVKGYQNNWAPRALEFLVDKTVLTFRDFDRDRLVHYLQGLLTDEDKRWFVEPFEWKEGVSRDWRDFVPESVRTVWQDLGIEQAVPVYLVAKMIDEQAKVVLGESDNSIRDNSNPRAGSESGDSGHNIILDSSVGSGSSGGD